MGSSRFIALLAWCMALPAAARIPAYEGPGPDAVLSRSRVVGRLGSRRGDLR
ncbi:MAG: hypothetical protein KJO11_06790 [Gemmatimonadetes bacterium]|nr:hypothetical protein [Gemmatimonadota bacterium]MBT8404216.1 hypothetical protein [Gemmatimonadota bacterium]NNF37688.1 hypothetical protein [Gemmatimonadota bacterium]NNK61575.1 hypothetical protein [Gemmatimonadota bacterium]